MGPDAEPCGFASPPTLSKLSWASFIWLALESEPRVLLSLKGDLWAEKMSLAAGYGASFSCDWWALGRVGRADTKALLAWQWW